MCDNSKWSCSICTYLNYDNARKCTMCNNTRLPDLILEPKNIYDIGPGNTNAENKWACPLCTYLNFAKSQKCTQCQTQNSLLCDQLNTLSLESQSSSKPLSIKTNIEVQQAEKVSPTENIKIMQKQTFQNFKWKCKKCTYENWPRASKCTMCSMSRSAKSLSPTKSNNIVLSDTEQDCDNKASGSGAKFESESTIVSDTLKEVNEKLSPSECASRRSPSQLNSSQNAQVRQAEGAIALNNYETERLIRHFRRRIREADWVFLHACNGVVEGNLEAVQAYLSAGGDPMRPLTNSDVSILNRPSAFNEGHTIVHLAIRFGREDLLATILSRMDNGASGIKRMPSYVAPDLANDIRRHIASCLSQKKGPISCYFVSEHTTYSLPAEIEDLPSNIQEQLFEEIMDRDAQKELEEDAPIINWSLEITERLGSRLYALWNRSAGDCLLDSVLQSSWSVFDNDCVLRRALSDSLSECASHFYPVWKDYESFQANLLNYYATDNQLMDEWAELVCLAGQPGSALEQLHIFVLAHILRRPIIVYGVKNVKSFRGENLGFARFEGVYIPFLWETSFCWKSPIGLGYTRGHFCALVPMEPESLDDCAGAILDTGDPQVVFFPLMTHDGKLLPVHFLKQSQMGCEKDILRTWMDVCVTESGILVAQQRLNKPPLHVAQMNQEWINHYKRMAQSDGAMFTRPISTQCYSSDGDSDEE